MKLLLIRHAIAEDRFEFSRTGKSDYYRPLTERGRTRMARGAAGLRTLVPEIDVLATSPLRLSSDSHLFSVSQAKGRTLTVDFPSFMAGNSYLVLGSISGTAPGIATATIAPASFRRLPWAWVRSVNLGGTSVLNEWTASGDQ